jgi:hypothetical protein
VQIHSGGGSVFNNNTVFALVWFLRLTAEHFQTKFH